MPNVVYFYLVRFRLKKGINFAIIAQNIQQTKHHEHYDSSTDRKR